LLCLSTKHRFNSHKNYLLLTGNILYKTTLKYVKKPDT
jgi:hypothetical protein